MTTADAPSYTLDSHEMRCLSVLKPMAFLMAVEYDIFLAATHAGQQPLEVQFPTVSQELKKALLLCASRFHLLTRDEDKKIIVHGVAALPLLRYVDFLPGQLHLDEVLSVANIKFTKTEPKRADKSFTDSKYAFVAAAIDYDTIGAEEPKFEAVSFFLTIDAGLPLASMGHLLRFEVPPTSTSSDAVKSFQRFSHWNKFDLRWDDEETKLAGVIVLPSTTDVHDLFERYEDEDTGDDATLLFRLRPIGACAHVPYLEDALLRRIREQAWKDVLSMWEASAHARAGLPTVTISGFSTTTSVDELLHVIDKSSVVDATLVVEDVPSKRRKLYVNLNSAEAVRVLLGQDGYRASQLSGKPNLRISVSPPYFADSRRGHVIMTVGMQGTRSPSPQPEFADPADGVNGRGGKKQAAGKKDSPQPSKTNSRSPQAHPSTPPITTGPQNGKSPSTTPPLRAAEAPLPASSKSKGKAAPANATDAKTRSPQASSTRPAPASADSGATNGKPAPAPKPSTSPQRHPASKSTAAAPAANAAPKTASEPRGMDRTDTTDSTDAPLERQLTATPSDPPKSKLNKAAAPFVPSGSPLQTFAPPPPPPPPPPSQPPPYAVAAPGQAGLPPPPYVPPPPTYLQTTSPLSHMVPHNPAVMPPAYSLSPPVYASMPPPYSKTPGGRPAPPPYIPTPTSSMGSPIGSEPNLPPPSSHE